jgi:hypothetical protein
VTRAEARTAIRAVTDHDADTQVTDAQLNVWIDIFHQLVRRELNLIVPQLYTATGTSQTLTGATESMTMPSDYGGLVRVEQQVGSDWFPIEIADELNPHIGVLSVREEGGVLKLAPMSLAVGTFRIVYLQEPATLSAESGTGGVLLVPKGVELVICEAVAAMVRNRDNDDPGFNLSQGPTGAIWKMQKTALRRRYGKAATPGLRLTRHW